MKLGPCALLLIATAKVFSQSHSPLTLDECIALALQNSPKVESSTERRRLVELSRSELSKTALPKFRVTAGGIYAPVTPHLGYDPAISNQGQVNGQLVVEQSVYDGGVRSLRSSQIDLDIDRAQQEHRAMERDVTLDVATHFIEILRAEREHFLRLQSIRQLVDYLDLLRQLTGGGAASQTDILKTEVQIANDHLGLQQADESIASEKYRLIELLGGAIDTSLTLLGSLDSLVIRAPDSLLAPAVLPENLDLRIAAIEWQSIQLDAAIASRERVPVLSLFADAGVLTSIENLKLPVNQQASIFGYSIGLSIDGLLFNWGATDLRVEQRRVQTEILKLQNLLLRRTLEGDYNTTRLHLIRAQERLTKIHATLILAEDNYLLTKATFAGGKALSIEVLSAQQLLTESRLAEVQTLADIQTAAAKLQQLTKQ